VFSHGVKHHCTCWHVYTHGKSLSGKQDLGQRGREDQ
jgi:hypothetical protein